MKELKLINSLEVALIDEEDYERSKIYKWYLGNDGYIDRYIPVSEQKIGEPVRIRLHRFILNSPKGQVDHKDRNRLNCQKDNLRIVTQQQNVINSTKRVGTISKYKGAFWHKIQKRWLSAIKINGKSKHLGSFNTEIEAARAYNEAAIKYFGEFAVLNKIEENE